MKRELLTRAGHGARPAELPEALLRIGFAAMFMLIPGLPLIQVMLLAQVVNGLLLPIILIFVMKLSREPNLGALRSGPILYPLGWLITGLASFMSLAFVASLLIGG